MGQDPLKWFLPILNMPGDGLAFPVSEDVRGMLRGMRGHLGSSFGVDGVVEDGDGEVGDDDDDTVYRRDEDGRWMRHD
jgi:hypothetical protein